MGNNYQKGQQGAAVPATQKTTAVANADFISYKNRITESVMGKIADLQKHGGVTTPKGYAPQNQIYLAFLKLAGMEDQSTHHLVLPMVTPQSVANSLLTMCIKGLSLDKSQCAFIKRGKELTLQVQYQGNIMMAKRYGAGDPQAQVIYEGDEFEFEINPTTGKKVVKKHVQKLENINNDKIVGAWCVVPYRDHPELEPKIEIMTMEEIRKSWMQGPTKGQSPAHKNFPQEMAKRTVINRACKLFVQTSDDAGVFEDYEEPEWQQQPEGATTGSGAEFVNLPTSGPSEASVRAAAEEAGIDPEPVADAQAPTDVEDLPEDPEPQPAPAPAPEGEQGRLDDSFFKI